MAGLGRSPEMKKMKIRLSLLFPDEIIEEIFSRLAVEPLMKFRCVSKSLNRLISSKRFIKMHLENSRKNRSFPHQRVIAIRNSCGEFSANQCSLQSLLKRPYLAPVDFPTSNVVRVVGSCDGVVCILRNERDFVMWNPSTKAVRKLPPLEHLQGWEVLGPLMGWDESRDDYKVFAFLRDRKTDSSEGCLYSSDTNSWTMSKHGGGRIFKMHGNGQFVSGKFHWLIERCNNWRNSYEIVSFDSKSGEFGVIGAPADATLRNGYKLAVVGGCLCVLDSNGEGWAPGIGVWVMKEYGVVDSWQKVAAVELEPLQPSSLVRGKDREVLLLPSFLVCSPNYGGEIHGPRGRMMGSFVSWRMMQMHLHIQSLVSP